MQQQKQLYRGDAETQRKRRPEMQGFTTKDTKDTKSKSFTAD